MTSPHAPGLPAGRLVGRTVEVPPASLPTDLLDLLPAAEPLAWLRRGEGVVGWGVAARCVTHGPDRFADAADWWRETAAAAEVADEVREPGTGLVCLGSFGFADEPGDSVLVVPEVLVGSRGGRAWVTVVGREAAPDLPDLAPTTPPDAPRGVTFADGAMSGAAWEVVVADAVARIGAGELEKVVLARDLVVTTDAPLDVRWPLRRLASDYEMCWTFHVDGLFGATPELLVRASAAWSPRGCSPAPSGAPATTPATPGSPASWRGPRRTSRSTSTPSARSPTRWRRTAPRPTCPRCPSCCTCPT